MNQLQTYLKQHFHDTIAAWDEDDIYAISCFVYANEAHEYNGSSNVPSVSLSYNTEHDCNNADALSEKRWNYAFWRQNETAIIEASDDHIGMKILFDWYQEHGVENIGYEDFDACFDDEMRYIGKGPNGYYELLSEICEVVKDLQESGLIKEKFGKPLPIIIHDLEYPWYVIDATMKANPHGEADVFLNAMKALGYSA